MQDGVEYDDNGNRKQYKTNGNIPRGYDRYSQEASQPRARPAYPVPKRTIDERRKAVSFKTIQVDFFKLDNLGQYSRVTLLWGKNILPSEL